MTKFTKADDKATDGKEDKLLEGLQHKPPVHTVGGALRIGKLKKEEPAPVPMPFGSITPKKY